MYVELLSFHIGTGIMISLRLQGVAVSRACAFSKRRVSVYILKTFCPQSDGIRSHQNAPKLTYSNLKFQNFPRAEIPDPWTPVKRGMGRGREYERRGRGRGGELAYPNVKL